MVMPKHIAISTDDIIDWCRNNSRSLNEAYARFLELLSRLLELQVNAKIPIFTVYLLPDIEKWTEEYMIFCDFLFDFFSKLPDNATIRKDKIKISIFGKWYNLPGKLVESLKKVIEGTKEYDNFFVNFCINYDGQEEIVDACKLIAKQVELGKIHPEMITKDAIKENIYSSYFLPPDVILIYGDRKIKGLLLWDSVNSNIVFADKSFMEFEDGDIEKLI